MLLLNLFTEASATELVTVTASPSAGLGPVGVFVFFLLLAAGFVVLQKKSPETAQAIVRALSNIWDWVTGLFRKR